MSGRRHRRKCRVPGRTRNGFHSSGFPRHTLGLRWRQYRVRSAASFDPRVRCPDLCLVTVMTTVSKQRERHGLGCSSSATAERPQRWSACFVSSSAARDGTRLRKLTDDGSGGVKLNQINRHPFVRPASRRLRRRKSGKVLAAARRIRVVHTAPSTIPSLPRWVVGTGLSGTSSDIIHRRRAINVFACWRMEAVIIVRPPGVH